MKTAGMICEYNPFHNGHKYILSRVRERLGEDCGIICVMSGNFVQRGEPAIINKHTRAEAAILGGADLVIELPVPWVLSSAEKFAYGGTALLNSLGVCTHIAFGCEEENGEKLMEAAECLMTSEIDGLIREELKKGVSYAAARQAAARRIMGDDAELLRKPNNILAVEYIKALKRINSHMVPVAIQRRGSGHDSRSIYGGEDECGFASASLIRELLIRRKKSEALEGLVPDCMMGLIERELKHGRAPINIENMEQAILYRLRTMTEHEYKSLPDNSEGVYRRLMENGRLYSRVEDVIGETKTKRYAMSRIRRMVMCAYLGITAEDSVGIPPYARVLGFGRRGQALLKELKKNSVLPILTKPASVRELHPYALKLFELEARTTDLYTLFYPQNAYRRGGQEWQTSPVRIL